MIRSIVDEQETVVHSIAIFTLIADLLFRTEDNMATPCSVKAKGIFREPPQLDIAICDFKFWFSSAELDIANCDLHPFALKRTLPSVKSQFATSRIRFHPCLIESKNPPENARYCVLPVR
jgi:hypothetical protein